MDIHHFQPHKATTPEQRSDCKLWHRIEEESWQITVDKVFLVMTQPYVIFRDDSTLIPMLWITNDRDSRLY